MLGVSCDYHDAAAALLIDGEIVAAVEEERISRVKHDSSLPAGAIVACLEIAGRTAEDIDHVVFYEKPLSVVSRYLAVRQRIGPSGIAGFVRTVPELVGRNLFIGYRLRRYLQELGSERPPVVQFVEHHHSHAAAAYFPSPFDSAAVLTIDGIGEWATATIGWGRQNRLEVIEEQRFPHSLGLVYSLITGWCGFTPNDGEYKLMGLAPYGTPSYSEALEQIISLNDDGSFEVDGKLVNWFDASARKKSALFELFDGAPRSPDAPLTRREADLAASVQQLTERAILALADRASELTGESSLCMAGGVALNCVANGHLLRDGPFDELWIQPAAGDAGSAIGAALAYWYLTLEQPRAAPSTDAMAGSLLGPEVPRSAIKDSLDELGVPSRELDDDVLVDLVAGHLADGDVVGWFRGRQEFGPRALGNRSILADPRDATVRSRLNSSVKGRESFRPFAPAVLEERAAEWFDLDAPSPYMLIVAPVRAEHLFAVDKEPDRIGQRASVPRSTVPACTHVDGTARIQTVNTSDNPVFRALIERFDALTGCPMVVNTSFNLAGEPVVATVLDAIRTARVGGIDVLVLGNYVVGWADLPSTDDLDAAALSSSELDVVGTDATEAGMGS